jgi:hypothetical protein
MGGLAGSDMLSARFISSSDFFGAIFAITPLLHQARSQPLLISFFAPSLSWMRSRFLRRQFLA